MTISINKLKPGLRVWDAHKVKAGNTTTSVMGCWSVTIQEVDTEKGTVFASWNGNPARTYYAKSGKLPWRATRPEPT